MQIIMMYLIHAMEITKHIMTTEVPQSQSNLYNHENLSSNKWLCNLFKNEKQILKFCYHFITNKPKLRKSKPIKTIHVCKSEFATFYRCFEVLHNIFNSNREKPRWNSPFKYFKQWKTTMWGEKETFSWNTKLTARWLEDASLEWSSLV